MRLDLNCQLLYSVQHLSVLTSSPSLGSSTELHCPGGVGGGRGGRPGRRASSDRVWVGRVWPHSCLCPGDRADSWTLRLRHEWKPTGERPRPAPPPPPPGDRLQVRRIIHLFNQSKLLIHLEQKSAPVRSKCIDFLWRDSKQSSALLCQHHKSKDSSQGFSSSLLCDVPTPCCAVTATNMLLCFFFFFLWITATSFKPHGAPY